MRNKSAREHKHTRAMKFKLLLIGLAAAQTAPAVNDLPSPYEVAQKEPSLSDLEKIYKDTEMKFKIDQSRDITVFMPNNDALAKTPLKKYNYPKLVQILNYHNLGRVVNFDDLKPGNHTFESIEGGHIIAHIDDKRNVVINDVANVKSNAIETPMGVAYIIDAVLMPEHALEETEEMSTDSVEIVDDTDTIIAPEHIKRSNAEQRRRNDVSGLVEAAADNVKEEDANADADGVGVITYTSAKRRTTRTPSNKGARNRRMVEDKDTYRSARAKSDEAKTFKVNRGVAGHPHSGSASLPFIERGKLY